MTERPPTATGTGPWRRLGGIGGRSLVFAALAVLLVLAAEKADLRWDLSADSRFSVHPALAALAGELTEPLAIVAVWRRDGTEGALGELQTYIDRQLRALAAASAGKLRYRHLDPEFDKPEVESLRSRIGTVTPGFLHLVHAAGRSRLLPVTWDLRFSLQRRIGGSIVALDRAETTPVYLLQGHGELGAGGGEDSMALFVERLALSGCTPTTLNPADLATRFGGRLPGDGVLVLAGPSSTLGAPLLGALDRALLAGARLLVLVDDRCPSDLAAYLEQRRGLQPGELVVHSLAHHQPAGDRTMHRLRLDRRFGLQTDSAATAQIRRDQVERVVIAPRCVPLARLQVENMPEEVLSEAIATGLIPPMREELHLVLPADAVWLAPVSDRRVGDPPDLERIVLARTVAYTAPDGGDDARLTLVGSRQIAADAWGSESAFGNLLLLTDLVTDLAGREAAVPIPEQAFRPFEVGTDEAGLNGIWALLVALIPSTCVGIAILTWWERRR